MKKCLFLSLIVAGYLTACSSTKSPDSSATATNIPATATPDNSKTSVDWPGTYRAMLPCGDCEGIKTELTLKQDQTYEMAMTYLGKSKEVYREKGTFQWNSNGNKITLSGKLQQQETNQYLVGENRLWKLDAAGQKVTGALAEKYILKKGETELHPESADNSITEKYWKLIELNGKPVMVSSTQPREPHFILKTENNRVNGHSGCNSFMGSYEISAGISIKFSPLAATRMACQDVPYESEFLKMFGIADHYLFQNDTLSLTQAGTAPLARFVAVYLR
ncbi:copper resistance protein NlpE N-terminal domain-containing protein [Adhaeribacter terreus]|uniref:Copper resistance protein NlpE N-terminal domain-containing protein n=1 Tax=Adhaeribacter terreus TaxID=529703 RepID=A0ABW0EAH7_9BACT